MQKQRSLVWLRSDLRITDNPALYYAAKTSLVTVIYLLFPKQWQQQHDSSNKIYFWMQNLQSLEQQLKRLNINLIVLNSNSYKQASKLITKTALTINCTAVWFNDEYGYYEQTRDADTEKYCQQHNISCHRFNTHTIVNPGDVLTTQGEYFQVFTPFKRKFYALIENNLPAILPKPKKQQQSNKQLDNKIKSYDYLTICTPKVKNLDKSWPASETAAHNRLDSFIKSTALGYDTSRDIPAITGTSMLSAYLTAGVLSVRQCFYAALVANKGRLTTGNSGLTTWLTELVWREFYKHILVGFPRVSKNIAFKVKTDNIIWQQDKKLFATWKQGKTGFPIVDAAMKQLVATGWMHNRLRMITAMFLTKNMMINWRWGEQFFMEHLIDGDLASNNGGWQWSASTGVDAVPYFRIFNPTNQSLRFDPEGKFIRYWLPELANLTNKEIHCPYQKKSNMKINYPKPVIDYKKSREQVIKVFKAL